METVLRYSVARNHKLVFSIMKEENDHFALVTLIPGRQEGDLRRYTYDDQISMKVSLMDLLSFCHHLRNRLRNIEDKFKLFSGGQKAKTGNKVFKTFTLAEITEPERTLGMQMKVTGGKSFFVPLTASEILAIAQIVEKMVLATLDGALKVVPREPSANMPVRPSSSRWNSAAVDDSPF